MHCIWRGIGHYYWHQTQRVPWDFAYAYILHTLFFSDINISICRSVRKWKRFLFLTFFFLLMLMSLQSLHWLFLCYKCLCRSINQAMPKICFHSLSERNASASWIFPWNILPLLVYFTQSYVSYQSLGSRWSSIIRNLSHSLGFFNFRGLGAVSFFPSVGENESGQYYQVPATGGFKEQKATYS